jgi:hypothetical protein
MFEKLCKVLSTPTSLCPVCQARLNSVLVGKNRQVIPGDVTICVECASFLVFEDDMKLRLITEQEILDLPDEFRMAIQAVREVIDRIKSLYM